MRRVQERVANHLVARLLERDVTRMCEYFARYGIRSSPQRLASDLSTAWRFADLVPEELRVELDL